MKNDKNIKVSILVPICNVEKYLDKCLRSITNQTLKEIEIICINDGSTDSSLSIIKRYAEQDSRIVIIDKPNSGYGDSMNKGLSISKGEYVGIVESDDFISADMYKDLYKIAKENEADLVKSNFYLYWETPEKTIYNNNLRINKIESDLNKCQYLLFSSGPSIWAAIYKNDWIKKENIKFLPTPGASFQDVSFKFKTTALANKIVLFPKAYLYYRQDNPNSSVKSTSIEKIYLNHKEYEEIENFIVSNSLLKFVGFYCTSLYNACILNYAKVDKEYKDKYYSYFSRIVESTKKWNVNKEYFPAILKYGGYYAIVNNKRWLLELVIKLKNFKKSIRLNV